MALKETPCIYLKAHAMLLWLDIVQKEQKMLSEHQKYYELSQIFLGEPFDNILKLKHIFELKTLT